MKNIAKISLPIHIEHQFLQDLINQQFKDILYKDQQPDHFQIVAKKCGQIQFQHLDDEIEIEIPLDLHLSKDTLLVNLEGSAKLMIHLKVKYHIRYDWSLSTETKISNYHWIEPPNLGIGDIHFSVQKLGDYILKRSQHLLSTKIDDAVAKHGNLKNKILPKWNKLIKPKLIDPNHEIWLAIQPSNLAFQPLVEAQIVLQSSVQLTSEAQIMIGKQPNTFPTPSLPDFYWKNISDKAFKLVFPIYITIQAINQILQETIVGKTIEKHGYKITMDQLEALFCKESLIVKGKFSGNIKGDFDFQGVPVLDAEKNILTFEKMEYGIHPSGFLMGLASKLFKNKIAETIEKATIIDLNPHFEKGMDLINHKISEVNIEHLRLDGKLVDLHATKTSIQDNLLQIDAYLQGEIAVFIG